EPAQAIPAFDALARDTSGGYAALARLREAGLKSAAGDREGAAATYRSVAEAGSAPQELRSLARVLASNEAIEKSSPADLDRELDSLRAESSPWRHSATELVALAALRTGDTAKAREL